MLHGFKKPLALLPIDYVFIGNGSYPIEFVFFFDYQIDDAKFKSALDKVLDQFYLLRSKLKKVSPLEYQLQPADDGFVYEYSDVTAAPFSPNPYIYLNSVYTEENEPLVKIKMTQTAEGSALGINISHVVADGFSSFYFLSQLAKAYQGKEFASAEIIRDWFSTHRENAKNKITMEQLISQTGFSGPFRKKEIRHEEVVWEHINISTSQIKQMLTEVATEFSGHLTRYDVVAAYLWKAYILKWQDGKFPEKTYITIPLDIRRFPGLVSANYFGNGACIVVGEMEYEKFMHSKLGELAQCIRSAINKVDKEYVCNSFNVLEEYRREEGMEKMRELHVTHPHAGIMVTDLSRVTLEGMDFGQGKPTRFLPVTPTQRGTIVFSTQEGLRVDICYPFD
jgi:NRPS condensation-like uncharacterized protein